MDGGHAYTLVDSAENLSPKHFSFHPAAKLRLQGTGFENLIKLSRSSSHFKSLIHAVADRYNRKEKCFEFGRDQKIRLFLGLGDVLRITGLPIDGWSVIVNEKEVNVRDLCIQCFGTDKCLEPSKTAEKPKSGICLTWLKDNYGHLDENYVLEGQHLDQYVRATVLYIIGSVVLPSAAKTVSPIYLTFLKNVDKIGSYAWGAAMLASLHRCLQNVNKCTSNCLYGNFHFVTVFILEHLPELASWLLHLDNKEVNEIVIAEDKENRPKDFPLLVGWHERLFKSSKKHKKHPNTSEFEEYFNNLSLNRVEWTPYSRLPQNFFPSPYNDQVFLERALTSLVSLEKVVLHNPAVSKEKKLRASGDLQLKAKHITKIHNRLDRSRRRRSRGGSRQDWPLVHKDFISVWSDRWECLYIADGEEGGLQNQENSAPAEEHDGEIEMEKVEGNDNMRMYEKKKISQSSAQNQKETGNNGLMRIRKRKADQK